MPVTMKRKHVRITKGTINDKAVTQTKYVANKVVKESKKEVPVVTGETRDSIVPHKTNMGWSVYTNNPMEYRDTGLKYGKGGRYEFDPSPNPLNKHKSRWLDKGKKNALATYKPKPAYDIKDVIK